MKLALLIEGNPREITSTHPSFLGDGLYRVVSSGQTKLNVWCRSIDGTDEKVIQVGDEFHGPCIVECKVIQPITEKLTIYAERLNA